MPSTVQQAATSFLTSDSYEAQQRAKLTQTEEDLGRDAFLQLFTTQLQNQNPLDPMENEAFVSQLAQFSSLEAMKGMQSSLEDVSSRMRDDQFLAGANLLGKKVSLEGGLVVAGEGIPGQGTLNLPEGADAIIFSVYDRDSGELVDREELGAHSPGMLPLAWDGTDSGGNPAPYGNYLMSATIVKDGSLEPIAVKTSSTVRAVNWNAETQSIEVEVDGGLVLSLEEMSRIEI